MIKPVARPLVFKYRLRLDIYVYGLVISLNRIKVILNKSCQIDILNVVLRVSVSDFLDPEDRQVLKSSAVRVLRLGLGSELGLRWHFSVCPVTSRIPALYNILILSFTVTCNITPPLCIFIQLS